MPNLIQILILISLLINLIQSSMVFIKLNLKDFDRTAAQIINGENTRRAQSEKPMLLFSYNLIKLADREVKKMMNSGSIVTPNLQVVLNRKNILAKVDKYNSLINNNSSAFMESRKCFDNYSKFVYKEWYSLTENCLPDGELDKATEYGFMRGYDKFKNVYFIQLFAYDRPVPDK